MPSLAVVWIVVLNIYRTENYKDTQLPTRTLTTYRPFLISNEKGKQFCLQNEGNSRPRVNSKFCLNNEHQSGVQQFGMCESRFINLEMEV